MKTALTGIPELAEGVICELYTFTFANGSSSYFTTADMDLPYRGQIYLSGVLIFDRGTIKTSVGVEVDDVSVTLYPGDGLTLNLPTFVNNGGLDGAWVKIERARNNYVVHLFEGMVSDASADRTKAEFTLSAGTLLLNIEMPRNAFTPGCIYNLFDSGCGLDKSSFAQAATVLSGSTARVLLSGLTQADEYFELGTVTFTSGENIGATRTVRSYTTGSMTLSYPLQHTPAEGDTFTAYPGCDKRMSICESKFVNKARYRGYPFIPVPEATI